MTQLEVIDLDSLIEPVAKIKVRGKEYDVMPVSGIAYDMATKSVEVAKKMKPEEQLGFMRKIIAELVPGMSEEDRARLSPKQMAAIVDIANRMVRKVEKEIGAREAKNSKRSGGRARSRKTR